MDLQSNHISEIENLQYFPKLNNLNLSRNEIYHISGLESLRNLQQLDLSKNKISKIEGLQFNMSLKELYISDQKTKNTMTFDFDSMAGISESLRFLQCNDNNVENIDALGYLVVLDTLEMKNNKIKDVLNLERALTCMRFLRKLDLRDNPMVQIKKHRDYVLMMCLSIQEFNTKRVLPDERKFLFKFHELR